MRKASAYFSEQTKVLRDNLEVAQSRLSKYQQEHGLVSVDNRLDVESNRLNDLSAQLVQAQGQMMEATSRQRMAQGSDGAQSPDVAQNSLIQSLKLNLGNAESKLAEMSQRLDRNHPLYQSTLAEVEKLRSELRERTSLMSRSVSNNAQILSQREAAVRDALRQQKDKVLELNRTRDEMNVLAKDVESAQRAFDATSQRFSQTRIEGASDQSDISVLNPAVAPIDPSSPKVLLNIVLSVFVGGMLGVGAGVLAELVDRRVRSGADLADALQLPVLGVVDWSQSGGASKPRRLINSVIPRRLRFN